MKQMWKELTLAAGLGLVLPAVLLSAAVRLSDGKQEQITTLSTEQSETTASTDSVSEPSEPVNIQVWNGEVQEEMELDEYLLGVLLAEMPVSFHPEAHKAQAVVARTYALKQSLSGSKHPGGVCTDPGCCQGYLSAAAFLERGGSVQELEQIRAEIKETGNQVLTYDGTFIEATYFSCSGGSTEDALAVWGTDIPYLQATDSPGEENATHYSDTVYFTGEEFAKALEISPSASPMQWLGDVEYTTGGGVATMKICGISFSGTTLRSLLGLRSTAFTMVADSQGITVTTRGYGHRVGMSQYGADAMASEGATYPEILAHYYQNAELVEYEGQDN